MADNSVVANPGVGGAIFASDQILGVEYPRAKLVWGVDGVATDASAAAPLPVVQTGTPALPTGAATEATLVAASAKLPATLGQKAMAASLSVALASDQPTLPVSAASLPLPSGAATETTLAALNTKTATAKTSDYDTGAGTDTVPMVGIALPASGGAVQGGTATNPVRTDPTGSTTQPISAASLPLPALAATSTKQSDGSQKSQIVDGSGNVIGATANALDVNIKSGGGSGGTSSSFGSAFPATGTAIGAKDSTGANLAALNLDAAGFLKVNVAAGGGAGGTSSSFGAAIPATGTAAGASDGTNMQLPRVFDLDSGAGTQYGLGVNLRQIASGGSVEAGIAANPLRIDPTGTTTQPVSAASLPLPTGASTAAKQPALGTAGAASADVLSVQGVASMTPLKTDGSGVTQPVSGTVTITPSGTQTVAGGKTNNNAAPGATNIGALPAVANAAAPTQTEGNLVALRATLSGDLAITLDSEAVVLGAGAATIGSLAANQSVNTAQINGVAPSMGNGVSGTGVQRVTLASDSTGQVAAIGPAAHGASISGAPVREGSRALTADFTAVTAGQVADAISTVLGKRIVLPYCLPGQAWKYVGAAGGLVNTTAITIAGAAGAGIKNYITSITLVNAHQTIGTEVVINDGAAGAAIFRTWCQFAGGGCSIKLDPPLASSANTLLEIKEITATGTAGVVAQILGYTAAE